MTTEPDLAPPIRVVSDLHLGHPASRVTDVAALRPILEGAATVIFNGDPCELSYSGWRPEGEALHADLVALCEEVGVRPVFVTGNHDPRISDTGWIDMGPVFVSHGDMILPTSAPWSWEYIRNKEKVHGILEARNDASPHHGLAHRYETLRELHAAMVPEPGPRKRTTGGGKYLLSALWPPERSFTMLQAWTTMVNRAEGFVARYRPESRAFLYGHFHRAGVWKRKGRIHVNTGSFMARMQTLVADFDGEALTVRKVEWSGGECRPGRVIASCVP